MIAGHKAEDGRIQSLEAHLEQVADLSGRFADAFAMRDIGELAGMLHDAGKAAKGPQRRILSDGPRADHSTFGAQLAWGKVDNMKPHMAIQQMLAFCVAGHHAGLPDGGSQADGASFGESTLMSRLEKSIDADCVAFAQTLPRFAETTSSKPYQKLDKGGWYSASFLLRMLFSCLVDADYLDTERFMRDGAVARDATPPPEALLERLDKYMQRFGTPSTELARIRRAILDACREAAKRPPGLFTLTVPTGGGKTLSSLAFALAHAKQNGLRRVIYAIPYTSILEQNAKVFEDAVGREYVLTHYADAYAASDGRGDQDDLDRKRLACENWDAPLIVTTNVRFFESLYAAKPSACRKLHNISRSVIVLDEAQQLPLPYLRPCLYALGELVVNYGCTVLLMSATQPPLAPLFPSHPSLTPTEIVRDTDGLYRSLQRVQIADLGTQTNAQLAERMCAREQALCVVNTRRHAGALCDLLPEEGRYCLTSFLTPKHRRSIFDEIRARLAAGLPCRVVSTSLMEAGVDLDFPMGLRARAGLDSILQAAGRVNREGRRAREESVLGVFDEEDEFSSERVSFVSQPASITRALRGMPMDDPATVGAYFRKLYHDQGANTDQKDIIGRLRGNKALFPFRTVAEDFHIIEKGQVSIAVPRDGDDRAVAQRLMNGEYSRDLIRSLGPCCVSVYPRQAEALDRASALCPVAEGALYILQDLSRYDDKRGLRVEDAEGAALIN